MSDARTTRKRCAIYTRKSSEEGLEQSFNSLDAQRDACAAFIESQRHEGWHLIRTLYDDGGYSGGNLDRPALKQLLTDIRDRKIDVVVVYKVDRLTRSLSDFAKIVDTFDGHQVSFVSVTQAFNTTSSMGRLTLNVLLSFAQFEREVTGERIRDKIAASKKKGLWMGGAVPLGYRVRNRQLLVISAEADRVRHIFKRYLELGSVLMLKAELDHAAKKSHPRNRLARSKRGALLARGALYTILNNPIYVGRIRHKEQSYPGHHAPIIEQSLWEQVQRQLSTHRKNRRQRTTEGSLLTGVLFDEHGRCLTPTHTIKENRRYRYYASSPQRDDQLNSYASVRVPAHEIESLVARTINGFLSNPKAISSAVAKQSGIPSKPTDGLNAAIRMSARWKSQSVDQQRQIIKSVTARITIAVGLVTIGVRILRLEGLLGGTNSKIAADKLTETKSAVEPIHILTVAASLVRAHGATQLVVVPESHNDPEGRPNKVLIRAIVRAHRWYEELISGHISSISAIAKREQLPERYVGRILQYRFMAPDVIESILDGRQPPTLLLASLQKKLPQAWDAQRALVDFAKRHHE